jgi:hypothetical protein
MTHIHRWLLAAALVAALNPMNAAAGFSETSMEPFGTFGGTEYVRYSGRFQGETELGEFDVPFRFVAPADPARGNRTVLVEPSHFSLGTGVRDLVLTSRFLFNRGFGYATLGFGANGLNVLDPAAAPIIVAGESVENPGEPDQAAVTDRGIVVQFAEMLRTSTFAQARFGPIERVYATGVSQTAEVLEGILLGPDAQGLFDQYLLVASLWEPIFAAQEIGAPSLFPNTRGTFEQPDGVGKIIWVQAEGDLLISNAVQFLNSVGEADSRLYQVAGGAHQPLTGALGLRDQLPFRANGLDWTPVARAAFVAGNRWVRFGTEPPPDQLFETTDEVDPVYGVVTGIARDENLNARGGVRLPDVEAGRFQFIASELEIEVPGLTGLIGREIDLECEPLSDGSERFPFRTSYDWLVSIQATRLLEQDLLLRGDAINMIFDATDGEVGHRGRCEGSDQSAAQ